MKVLTLTTLAAILTLGACSSGTNQSMPQTVQPSQRGYAVKIAPTDGLYSEHRPECPKSKYSLGCVTISPSGPGETITFSCDGGYNCPVPKWLMHNTFYTVRGKPADKVLAGQWDPNPYYSGPSTYTINLVTERKAITPSNKVEYYVVLTACRAKSSCTRLGTVGLIPLY